MSSSLTLLQKDVPPNVTTEQFLQQCSSVLEIADFNYLSELSFDSGADLASLKAPISGYFEWELALCNCLASYRHEHPLSIDRQHTGHIPEFTIKSGAVGVGLEALLHECLNLDPLQAERHLYAARWQQLEFVRGIHQSDLIFLSVYRLQLLLLENSQCWQQDAGKQRYDETCRTILGRFKGSLE